MNVVDELGKIVNKICDEYCKWPEKYLEKYGKEDANEKIVCEKCMHCPMMKLL